MLSGGDIKSSKHSSLKMCKGKIKMKILNEMGIHIEERRVSGVYGSDILARHHWFKYYVFLLKISRDVILHP
jgi:hypothetical protein